MKSKHIHLLLLLSGLAVLIWSGAFPKERFTWLMEVFPAILGGIIFLATYRRFPLTTMAYTLAWFFSLILIIGGHWTYAEVPIGNRVSEYFGWTRNHYDRFGHFFQGFVPAILAREVILRTSPLRPGKWLFTLVTGLCLAISACYELFEWGYAVVCGDGSDSFLGSQGDIWDAQWDMFLALCGAILAQLLLARWHDRQIRKLTGADMQTEERHDAF
jgi:putative membrane protein